MLLNFMSKASLNTVLFQALLFRPLFYSVFNKKESVVYNVFTLSFVLFDADCVRIFF